MAVAEDKELKEKKPRKDYPAPTMGSGIAIAGIWASSCAFLGFLAWVMATKVSVEGPNDKDEYMIFGFGYFLIAILVLGFGGWSIYTVVTGRS